MVTRRPEATSPDVTRTASSVRSPATNRSTIARAGGASDAICLSFSLRDIDSRASRSTGVLLTWGGLPRRRVRSGYPRGRAGGVVGVVSAAWTAGATSRTTSSSLAEASGSSRST